MLTIYYLLSIIMNLVPLLYVGFRIIPFILVSFFVLSSILKTDVRGVIFLGLLLINCAVVIMFNSLSGSYFESNTPDMNKAMCNALSIGNTSERISTIPLNINIVAFTFAYLVYLIAKKSQVTGNIHSIVFFSVLLSSMIAWELLNMCASIGGVVVSLLFGITLGVGFCEMLDFLAFRYNIKGLHFFSNVTNDDDVCKMTNEDLFECSSE